VRWVWCANNQAAEPAGSRSSRFEPVLVMKTAENRRGDDAVAVANPMARRHRRAVGRIRNTGPEARVWTPAIVVRDPVPENSAKVPFVEGHHPVQAFAANGADHAFAERVRLRRSHRCLENRQPHCRDRAINPSE